MIDDRARIPLWEIEERWKRHCEEASTEQDPERMIEWMCELNALLEEKQARLK